MRAVPSPKLPDQDIYNKPPKLDVPDWLNQYVDEENGSIDYDNLINDGRYNEYLIWQQTRVTPLPPSSIKRENKLSEGGHARGTCTFNDVWKEVRGNVWGDLLEGDSFN